jgi:hypothetical protein
VTYFGIFFVSIQTSTTTGWDCVFACGDGDELILDALRTRDTRCGLRLDFVRFHVCRKAHFHFARELSDHGSFRRSGDILTAARVSAAHATFIIDTSLGESYGVVRAIEAEKRPFPILVPPYGTRIAT